ncbi:YgaP family membrane protein [Moraxella catarrhalis]|uniref:YgaP family membrane protein n=1 Tax=Moraxella catarrhalis TaxID=480 RepID=UPI000DFB934A|nr:DUF2892 domain-containing protein [Moraxella catarrhalis]STY80465.1 Protein of uncharacterised function (DUF2892) [Moraxella catarrhalis]
MKANLHQVDRIIRIVIGITLIVLPLFAVIGWWGYVVGAILLATGLINFCPIYRLLGINTCKYKR